MGEAASGVGVRAVSGPDIEDSGWRGSLGRGALRGLTPWPPLPDRRLRGIKFRRQHPISIYVADFYCHELKLVIELDGEVHDDPRQVARDANRDFYLRSLGCTILRIPNHDLFHHREAIITHILEVATTLRSSHLPPLPPGEGARG